MNWFDKYISAEKAISNLTDNIEVLLKYLRTEPNGNTQIFRERAKEYIDKTDELQTIKLENKL